MYPTNEIDQSLQYQEPEEYNLDSLFNSEAFPTKQVEDIVPFHEEVDFGSLLNDLQWNPTADYLLPEIASSIDTSSVNPTFIPTSELVQFDQIPYQPEIIETTQPQQISTITTTTQKRRTPSQNTSSSKRVKSASGSPVATSPPSSDKYERRLQANKRSAHLSRERKKAHKAELEESVCRLTVENQQLAAEITELQTESQVLKREFINLQNLIAQSPVLSKMLARSESSILNAVHQEQESLKKRKQHQLSLLGGLFSASGESLKATTTTKEESKKSPRLLPTTDTKKTSLSTTTTTSYMTSSPQTPTSMASWYTMIVLYCFNQYFQTLPASQAYQQQQQLLQQQQMSIQNNNNNNLRRSPQLVM